MKNRADLLFNFFLLAAYLFVIAIALIHHELWGDELHSWNIAKASHSLAELMQNIRYEGHPPIWYLCLYSITCFSHNMIFLKALQFLFVAAAAMVFVFFAPFSRLEKILLLSGYYFIFEYAVLARNYMPGIFFAFILASIYNREFRFRILVYYLCLFLLSNVHLLGLLLAFSIHAGFCYDRFRNKNRITIHVVTGVLLLIPSVFFILPPTDSQLNAEFWISQWSVSRLYLFVTIVVKSLLPFQEWFNYHWWNTNFFLDNNSVAFRITSLALFFLLMYLIWKLIKNNKTAAVLIIVNMLCSFLVSLVFPLNTARYAGFVLIGLMIATWITYQTSHTIMRKRIFILLLLLQVCPGIFAVSKDSIEEFSSADHVTDMKFKIPQGSLIVTDYWSLNSLAAYLDTSFYCIELGKDVSFLKWDSNMKRVINYDYKNQLSLLFEQNQRRTFYYFSMFPPGKLLHNGVRNHNFRCELISDSGISIERSGRIYLYRVGE